jgi:signal transduction histidine kinase
LRLNKRQEDVTVDVKACSITIKPGDLTRIVEELADNACKFSRQGTPVKVEFGADGRLLITDEGRGLMPEQINHIGAFQQFDRKKNEQQGLGLGLVLVQKLTALCQAEFSINSQPGKGTQAQIAFPTANPA